MFHVKRPQGESSDHTCVGIVEPQDVAIAYPNIPSNIAIANAIASFATGCRTLTGGGDYYICPHEKIFSYYLPPGNECLRRQLP